MLMMLPPAWIVVIWRDRTKMKPKRSSDARVFQYSRGEEVCVSCHHESTLTPTRRCTDCDHQVCTLCVVLMLDSGEALCFECARDRDQEANARTTR